MRSFWLVPWNRGSVHIASALMIGVIGCGRGSTLGLGPGGVDDDGGLDSGIIGDIGGRDFGVSDGPFTMDLGIRDIGGRDMGVRDNGIRDGFVPDVFAECRDPRDCFAAAGGPPLCPSGSRGRWLCNGGFCEAACPCASDCECSFQTACIGGACVPAGRENLCCTNPNCPPGAFCQVPGGGGGICLGGTDGGPSDGGLRDTGAFDGFVPDFGPLPDGGRRDFGPLFDASFPDTGFLDASFPDTGVPTTPVGDPCAAQGLCGPIGFCIEEDLGFPGGYCSQACDTTMGGLACPSGASCRDFPGQSLCLENCIDNTDCRTPDYACIQLGTDPNKVCWPVDPGSTNPNGEPVGGECGGDQDCDNGLTCLDVGGWPDGYCTRQFCDPQNNPCPSGSACYAFSGFFSLCLADCPSGGSQSTCRADYYCLGAIGQPGGCVPN